MTAKIFELGHKSAPRPVPPGERRARPDEYRRVTGRIRPAGVELRYAGALKASEAKVHD